ncbi:hypothetical protein [Streptococcus uberis]|nr:hypothetical protein [Streptococcus uberis]
MNYTVTVYKNKVAIETHWAPSHLEARIYRFELQKKYDGQKVKIEIEEVE